MSGLASPPVHPVQVRALMRHEPKQDRHAKIERGILP
uniref:Uncharacterized protein n=1 Tax=Caudovirales sp. ctrNG92 TaxID=2827638 RepID=A0A8S5SE80_9CAUD|nr:MAG TPA: hypothetical protein [Caudovirales sp. ctrNG92]